MSADLSQAEIYILLCPRAEAEQEIVRMVEKALGGYSLPPLAPSRAPGIPGTTSGDDWLTLASLAAIADRVRREGLLVLPGLLEQYSLPLPLVRALLAVSDGEDPRDIACRYLGALEEAGATESGAPCLVPGLYGCLMIAHGFEGLVLRIFFEKKLGVGLDAAGQE
jgi:hypothetical protein